MNQTPKNFDDTRDLDRSQDAAPLESTELHRTSRDSADVGILIGEKYKLVQRIGEGGMGTVWLAEQREPVRRKVAVKLVKAGMDSRQVLARFEAERQALAVMDHPNIAKVFDGGVSELGRPYFAMELVKGIPLTDYCDQVQYSVRERLQLFCQVCSAVQHAHQKGIIHRDLKPSNILVTEHDGKPMVKVIDFGLAKALHGSVVLTDHSMHTAFGAVLGTPLYMAPEQLGTSALDVDTRADLYSLGVLLYELLTGTTPIEHKRLKQAAWEEMCRMIREEEPPRPSTRLSSSDSLPSVAARRHVEPARLTRLVRGELDWIIMKTLEKDRNRRYETASGLGLDIQRYLTGEPVLAAPPSKLYRFRKFVRRNRSSVVVSGLLLSSLAIGTVGTGLGLIEANRQTRIARRELLEKEVARADEAKQRRELEAAQIEIQKTVEAERNARIEEQKQREFAEAINQFVKNDLLAMTSVEGQERFSGEYLGKDLSLRDLLERAANKLEDRRDLAPAIEAELRWIIGTSLRNTGSYEKAVPLLERSLELISRELGEDHETALEVMTSLARAHDSMGHYNQELALWQQVFDASKKRWGIDHPNTLLAARNLAHGLHVCEQLEQAIELYENTAKRCREILGSDHSTTLSTLSGLGVCYCHAGRATESLPILEEVLESRTTIYGDEHLDTLVSMNDLSIAYVYSGRSIQAIPLAEKSLNLHSRILGEEHPDTLSAMNNLAAAYEALGDFDKAVSMLEQIIKITKVSRSQQHPDLHRAMNNLALGYSQVGKTDESVKLLEELLLLSKASFGDDHLNTLNCMMNLAGVYKDLNRLHDAIALHKTCLDLSINKLGPQHPETLLSKNNLATSILEIGRIEEATRMLEELLPQIRDVLGEIHPLSTACVNNLTECYLQSRLYQKAIELLEEYIAVHSSDIQPDKRPMINFYHNLAAAYELSGKTSQAFELYQQATEEIKLLNFQHPSVFNIIPKVILAFDRGARIEEAEALRKEWHDHLRNSFGARSAQYANQLAAYGFSLIENEQWEKAEMVLRECLEIRQEIQADDWRTFNTQSLLGAALLGFKKFEEAEPLLLTSYEGMKARENSIPADARFRIEQAVERIVELYTLQENVAELQKWRALHKEIR